jgi:biopolymer transport protein ExbD
MRLRTHLPARVPIDMTPLIDIVFQLLIFFILTLQIAPPEREFAMRMPQRGIAGPTELVQMPLVVELSSDADGRLASVALNGERLAGMTALHERVAKLVTDHPQLKTAGRVELRCDEQLAYEHAIAALGAVSANRHPDGSLTRLIEQVQILPR